jgi:excinuclease ABC subunit C
MLKQILDSACVVDRANMTDFLKRLPNKPGVYRHMSQDGEILYVGKALNLKKRISSYFARTQNSPRIAAMVSRVHSVEISVTETESQALLLEAKLIKRHRPRYNIVFRDDKTYPYLLVSQEKYPRLAFFRGQKSPDKRLFGPYPSALSVKHSLRDIQKFFKLRTCENTIFHQRVKPCLEYQIGRCSAPCVDLISPEAYGQDVSDAVDFLNGRTQQLLSKLEKSMLEAAENMDYEKAAMFRDRIAALSDVVRQHHMEIDNPQLVADLIVVAKQLDHVCVNVGLVRGGQYLGDRSVMIDLTASFIDQPEEVLLSNVLENFLLQHYLDQPPEGLVISLIPVRAEILDSLAEQHQKKIVLKSHAQGVMKQWMLQLQQNALMALERQFGRTLQQKVRVKALLDRLGEREPAWLSKDLDNLSIECFDISHTSGEATTASCVVYRHLAMQSSMYRRYRIQTTTIGDDYAAMAEVLNRRLLAAVAGTHALPDIWLIDGGESQIEVARSQILAVIQAPDSDQSTIQTPLVLGISKGEGRKAGLETIHLVNDIQKKETEVLPVSQEALSLLIEIRDEAHRFAITGMRKARDKVRRKSMLEEISGIGSVRRRKLLTHFGGISGLKDASIEQIAHAGGISKTLAKTIYDAIRG